MTAYAFKLLILLVLSALVGIAVGWWLKRMGAEGRQSQMESTIGLLQREVNVLNHKSRNGADVGEVMGGNAAVVQSLKEQHAAEIKALQESATAGIEKEKESYEAKLEAKFETKSKALSEEWSMEMAQLKGALLGRDDHMEEFRSQNLVSRTPTVDSVSAAVQERAALQSKEIDSLRSDLSNLQGLLDRSEEDLHKATVETEEQQSLATQLQTAQRGLEQANRINRELEEELAEKEKASAQLQTEHAALKASVTESSDANVRVQSLEDKTKQLQVELEDARNSLRVQTESFDNRLLAANEQARQENDALQQSHTELSVQLQNQSTAHVTDINNIKRLESDLRLRIETQRHESDNARNALQVALQEQSAASLLSTQGVADVQARGQELEQRVFSFEQVTNRLRDTETTLRSRLEEQRETIEADNKSFEREKATLQWQIQDLDNQLGQLTNELEQRCSHTEKVEQQLASITADSELRADSAAKEIADLQSMFDALKNRQSDQAMAFAAQPTGAPAGDDVSVAFGATDMLDWQGASVDDLRRIKGIGRKKERRLNALGIYRFEQLAKLSDREVDLLNFVLKLSGAVKKQHWVNQAKVLAGTS